MASKTVHRHRFVVKIESEIAYDPTKPETYTAALATIGDIREKLKNIGGGVTILHDAGKPVTVRG